MATLITGSGNEIFSSKIGALVSERVSAAPRTNDTQKPPNGPETDVEKHDLIADGSSPNFHATKNVLIRRRTLSSCSNHSESENVAIIQTDATFAADPLIGK